MRGKNSGREVSDPSQAFRRRPRIIEVLAVLLLLPSLVTSLLIVVLMASLIAEILDTSQPSPWIAGAVAVYVLGAILMVTPLGDAIVARRHGQRRLEQHESDYLIPVWHQVCTDVGVDSNRFTVLIEDSDEVNALALGSRTVGITRAALHEPPDFLAALLAHELGHHARWHSSIALMGRYFTYPTRITAQVLLRVVLFAFAVVRGAVAGAAAAGSLVAVAVVVVVALVLAPLALYAVVPLGFILGVDYLSAAAGRQMELSADDRAADWGYGPLLIDAIVSMTWTAVPHLDRNSFERASRTHPAPRARIRRLMRRSEELEPLHDDVVALIAQTQPQRWALGSSPTSARRGAEPPEWGLERISFPLREWVHGMASHWIEVIGNANRMSIAYDPGNGSSADGTWRVWVWRGGWVEIPFGNPPCGQGAAGVRSVKLRELVMRAFLEERGWRGSLQLVSKEHGSVYREIVIPEPA